MRKRVKRKILSSMFSYDVRVRGNKAYYSTGWISRGLSALFFLVLLSGFLITFADEGFSASLIFPLLISLILLFGFLYRDEWVFDNEKREAVIVFGIAFFVKKTVISYDDIKCIEVSHFLKGVNETNTFIKKASWKHPEQITLSLRLDDEEETRYSLEVMSEKKSGGKVDRNASYLSVFTGIELRADKLRDNL